MQKKLPTMEQVSQGVIVWALDAFDSPPELLEAAVEILKRLEPLGSKIQPVYILTPSQLNLSTEFSNFMDQPLISNYKPAALKAIKELVHRFPSLKPLAPDVVAVDVSAAASAPEVLSSYAVSHGAHAIVVSSHGRVGMRRFFLGSFTESLLFKSEVPVVVVHPHPQTHSERPIKRILFPTDFGPFAKQAFHEVVDLAKIFQAEVTLFHSIPHPVEPILQSGVYLLGGGWVPLHAHMDNEVKKRERVAEAWVRWARIQAEVGVTPLIHSDGGSVSDLVVNHAESGEFDLITIAAQSGPISSVLVGSVTRQVVRHSHCPVWVIRFQSSRHRTWGGVQVA